MNYSLADMARDIKEARLRSGLSQRDLSARTGVTQGHISQIESGKLSPGVATLIDIARALELEIVLVPRRLMPAINSLVKPSAATPSGMTPESGREALKQISRGERMVEKLISWHGRTPDYDRIAEYLRYFRSANLRSDDVTDIRKSIDHLHGHQDASAQSRAEVKSVASILQMLRNRVDRRVEDMPRPAYSLDEDDDA